MSKEKIASVTPEELVAAALNEQGYLLQHKVNDVLKNLDGDADFDRLWTIDATEVPVSLPDGRETRIDLVLRRGRAANGPWRVVVECKRAMRDYKRWVFFGTLSEMRGPSPANYYFERADLSGTWDHSGKPNLMTRVEQVGAVKDCPVFEYGIEVRMNSSGHQSKSSATEAIESAFQQVVLGQTGLGIRVREAKETNYRFLPIVVTTAELMSAEIPLDQIPLETGIIPPSAVALTPRKWLATHHRVNNTVAQFANITTNRNTDLAFDIVAFETRTIFVTEAKHLQEFLAWLDSYLKSRQI